MRHVLVIDDELAMPPAAARFRSLFAIPGFALHFTATHEQALKLLASELNFSLVLQDVRFAGVSSDHGLEILEDVVRRFPSLPVIVMSSRREPEILIRAWDLGARSFIVKWSDNEQFREELTDKVRQLARYQPSDLILGNSAPIANLKSLIAMVAEHDTTVLVQGETGTGKELVAESLHRQGPRAEAPLVKVNCAVLPDHLIESELFGHKKGAFTDATSDHRGKVEEAEGGVLFLDEIGELKAELQSKLLRFIDRKEFSKVGEAKTRTVDVQIIAATNRELGKEVQEGRFRHDLLQRLKMFTIDTPPLRDCREDIPLLSDHFLELLKNRRFKPVTGFSAEAMQAFLEFEWPGNVRQLSYTIERAFILTASGTIGLEVIPDDIRGSRLLSAPNAALETGKSVNLKRYLAEVSWVLIRGVYEEELAAGKRGVKKRTAQRLGLNPVNGLGRKLDEIRTACPELATEIGKFLED